MDDDALTSDTPATALETKKRARLAWEAARIEEARESIRREGTIPFEEVRAWLESWDTPNELPQPQPRLTSPAAGQG